MKFCCFANQHHYKLLLICADISINNFFITKFPSVIIFTKESAATMKDLVKKGTFGFGVFECKDIFATYEELKAKGG
jgi:hypothetical protein